MCDPMTVFNSYDKKNKDRGDRTIEEIYQTIQKKEIETERKWMLLTVNGETADGDDASIPDI